MVIGISPIGSHGIGSFVEPVTTWESFSFCGGIGSSYIPTTFGAPGCYVDESDEYVPGYMSPTSPKLLCDGYFSDGISINIPISCLPGLSVEEANAVSGDWREIFQAILLMSNDWINSYSITGSFQTYDSFFLQNPNSKRSIFQYGIGEHNLFLEKFVVTYKASNLKEEN